MRGNTTDWWLIHAISRSGYFLYDCIEYSGFFSESKESKSKLVIFLHEQARKYEGIKNYLNLFVRSINFCSKLLSILCSKILYMYVRVVRVAEIIHNKMLHACRLIHWHNLRSHNKHFYSNVQEKSPIPLFQKRGEQRGKYRSDAIAKCHGNV